MLWSLYDAAGASNENEVTPWPVPTESAIVSATPEPAALVSAKAQDTTVLVVQAVVPHAAPETVCVGVGSICVMCV